MSLQQSKSILAKLLATENIKVEFRKVETASFDVKTRTMTLPLWDDMSPELYDLLGGHEVGHALHTPAKGWHDILDEKIGKNFKTFLNVVEDARIERKIKEKFPGIRKSFSKGYSQLLEKNFFGINGVDVNGLLLIDRINLHYKLGALAGIEFSTDEMTFIRRIDVAETWNDVVSIAKDLFAYCKEEMDKMREEQKQRMMSMKMNDFGESGDSEQGQGEESYDDSFDDGEDSDEFGDNSWDDLDGDEKSFGSEDDDSEDYGDKNTLRGAGGSGFSHVYQGQEDPISITDKNFQEKVKTLAQSKNVYNGFLPSFSKTDTSKVVVDWRKMYGKIANTNTEHYKTNLFQEFENKNKNAILYLVKEFELRKRAAELRRVSIADTGVIDTNLLHSYKFSDNIFRKIATVAEGKNHGLVAMVDWSGSMQNNLYGTVEQFLILAMFCRKLNIPFEVYAFSDNNVPADAFQWMEFTAPNVLDLRQGFQLLNLMSSRMGNLAFRKMANDLLNVGKAYSDYANGGGWASRYAREEVLGSAIHLGGTPLNASIIALSKIVADFRKTNRLEIVNTVILTDGEDSDILYTLNSTQNRYSSSIGPENNYNVSYIFDDETKKNFRIGPKGVTPALLQILKTRTGCNLIGFYVITNNKKHFDSALYRLDNSMLQTAREKALREFRENGVYPMLGWGYDEYYLIPGGKNMEASDDNLDDILGDSEKVSTRKLSGAFLKLNQNRLNTRILLKKFIEKTT